MADVQVTGGGLGLPTVLTLISVVLKLVGVITWSWLWVLSPLWVSFLLVVAIVLLFFAGALLWVGIKALFS